MSSSAAGVSGVGLSSYQPSMGDEWPQPEGGTFASTGVGGPVSEWMLCSRPVWVGARFYGKGGLCTMGAKSNQVQGQAKETVGGLIGDKDLESEGKADRRGGEAKEKLDHAKDKVGEVIDKAKDKVGEVIDKAKDAVHRK